MEPLVLMLRWSHIRPGRDVVRKTCWTLEETTWEALRSVWSTILSRTESKVTKPAQRVMSSCLYFAFKRNRASSRASLVEGKVLVVLLIKATRIWIKWALAYRLQKTALSVITVIYSIYSSFNYHLFPLWKVSLLCVLTNWVWKN